VNRVAQFEVCHRKDLLAVLLDTLPREMLWRFHKWAHVAAMLDGNKRPCRFLPNSYDLSGVNMHDATRHLT